MPYTLGDLRAAIEGQPDHITLQLPIPRNADSAQGIDWVDITNLTVAGDTADIDYDEPTSWGVTADDEREVHEANLNAGAYLASTSQAVSDAVRMALQFRLGALADEPFASIPEAERNALITTLHEDILIGLRGTASRHLRANPPA